MEVHPGTREDSVCRTSSSQWVARLVVATGNLFVEFISEWHALGHALVGYVLRSYDGRFRAHLAGLMVLA